MKTSNMHYVFQGHLKRWGFEKDKVVEEHTDKKYAVYCTFDIQEDSNLRYRFKFDEKYIEDVASEIDFYRIPKLSPQEQKVLKMFASSEKKKMFDAIVQDYDDFFVPGVDPEWADAMRNNKMEEYFRNSEENKIIKLTNSLQKGMPLKSCIDKKNKSEEYYRLFLSQYFRTKIMRERVNKVIKEYLESVGDNESNPNNISFYLLTYDVPSIIAKKCKEFDEEIKAVKASSSIKFITSDQPIINLKANYRFEEETNELLLFYPLSPDIALLIGKGIDKYPDNLDDDTINELNSKMDAAKDKYLFFSSEGQMMQYMGLSGVYDSTDGKEFIYNSDASFKKCYPFLNERLR